MTRTADLIASLTSTPVTWPQPPHTPEDDELLASLTASMETDGWVGAPIVTHAAGMFALTGSHRLAAAQAAGLTTVPQIDVAELAAEHDIDWDALVTEQGYDYWEAARELTVLLPAEVVAALGLDAE